MFPVNYLPEDEALRNLKALHEELYAIDRALDGLLTGATDDSRVARAERLYMRAVSPGIKAALDCATTRQQAAVALARFGRHDPDCHLKCGCGDLLEHHSHGICLNCGGQCPNPQVLVDESSCTCGFLAARRLFADVT